MSYSQIELPPLNALTLRYIIASVDYTCRKLKKHQKLTRKFSLDHIQLQTGINTDELKRIKDFLEEEFHKQA